MNIRTERHAALELAQQTERDEATRDDVRRILGDSATMFNGEYAPYAVTDSMLHTPLTEADLDAQERFKRAPFPITQHNHAHRHSRPACSRCESGLTHCATPAACERAEDRPPPERGDLIRVLAMATWPLYFVAIGAFFAWMLS
jgi:hypothetical protein